MLLVVVLIEENAKETISLDSLVCKIFLLVSFFPFLASIFHLNLNSVLPKFFCAIPFFLHWYNRQWFSDCPGTRCSTYFLPGSTLAKCFGKVLLLLKLNKWNRAVKLKQIFGARLKSRTCP